jgi:dimethylhistidine N-methyltransferase
MCWPFNDRGWSSRVDLQYLYLLTLRDLTHYVFMNQSTTDSKTQSDLHGRNDGGPENVASTVAEFRTDVYAGLKARPKTLPCKYFYDRRGSELFEQICELPEYYPTRVEISLMNQYAQEMGEAIGSGTTLVEFGSGSSLKTRHLLGHLVSPAGYIPVDVSGDFLLQTAAQLQRDFPNIEILPAVADFTLPFQVPQTKHRSESTTVYFPGSTIGNFEPDEVEQLLQNIVTIVGPGGGLLIGIDLHKDVATLEAAYDDEQGVTSEFNLNLLHRINGELLGDFNVERFEHRAVYNSAEQRIEMSLVSAGENHVTIGEREFSFEGGEEIITEYSHKYDLLEFTQLAAKNGLKLEEYWTDDEQQFAVIYLRTEE